VKIRYEGGTICLSVFRDLDGTSELRIVFDDDGGSDLCYTATDEGAKKAHALISLGWLRYQEMDALGEVSPQLRTIVENEVSG
jgi:hypothetical protein